MKGQEAKEKQDQKVKVDASLKTYVGQDISPKKTEHVNSIADHIKRALSKFRSQPTKQ